MHIFLIIVLVFIFSIIVYKITHPNEIRYIKKAKHRVVIVRKKFSKWFYIRMSSKPKSGKKENIPMHKNAEIGNESPSYFVKKVRNNDKKDFGKISEGWELSKIDSKKASEIYYQHRKSKLKDMYRKIMKKYKKKIQVYKSSKKRGRRTR